MINKLKGLIHAEFNCCCDSKINLKKLSTKHSLTAVEKFKQKSYYVSEGIVCKEKRTLLCGCCLVIGNLGF